MIAVVLLSPSNEKLLTAQKEVEYTYAKCQLYGWGCEQDKKEAKEILQELGDYRESRALVESL